MSGYNATAEMSNRASNIKHYFSGLKKDLAIITGKNMYRRKMLRNELPVGTLLSHVFVCLYGLEYSLISPQPNFSPLMYVQYTYIRSLYHFKLVIKIKKKKKKSVKHQVFFYPYKQI